MTRPMIAALGDSLTAGEHADGTPLHNHPWVAYLDANLFPEAGVANFGVGGNTISQMQTRYTNYIKGVGYKVLILWGGINDIIQNQTGAATWALMDALIAEALADGLAVILVTTPGFASYSGWSSGRQTQLDALRALMAARTGVTKVNLYQQQPTGMDDGATPAAIYSAYAYSDGLHINPTGALHLADPSPAHNDILTAVLRAIYPVVTPPALLRVEPKGGALGQLDPIYVDVASLSGLELKITTSSGLETIYSAGAFDAAYVNSSAAAITGGQRVTVLRVGGWPDGQLVLEV